MNDPDVLAIEGSVLGHATPLVRDRLAWDLIAPAALTLTVVISCYVVPAVFSIPPPSGGDATAAMLPSLSPGHALGTDVDGNDVLSRLLYGGRNSLSIAAAVSLLGLIVGGSLGAVSGYAGGLLDTAIMRLLDVLLAFPSLILIIAVAQSLGPSSFHTIIALSFFSIPAFARIARGSAMATRRSDFVVAARICGSRPARVLYLHVLPHALPSLLTFLLLGMGITMLIEGALSYLGLGVPPPAPSWGNMIANGQHAMALRPSLVALPSGYLLIAVLALNWLGDSVRQRWSRL